MDQNTSKSRRRFLTNLAAAGALLPLMRAGNSAAADLPHLSPSNPTAKALHYTQDASKLTAKTEPVFKAGSHCGICSLFQGGSAQWGPCGIFPGNAVHTKGWCESFTPKS